MDNMKMKIQLDRLGRAYSSMMGALVVFGGGLTWVWLDGKISAADFKWGITVIILGAFVAQLLFDKCYTRLIQH